MTQTCPKCGDGCRMREQAAWPPERVAEYLATPIPYTLVRLDTATATLGLDAYHTKWVWRAYADRPADHRADYDRLLVSIYHEGVKTPVIGWRGHVLVGQRRVEIARRLGIGSVEMLEIGEDVTLYWTHDVERIKLHLTPVAGQWQY